MTVKIHTAFDQGSGEWLAQRCGMLTASEIKNIVTPTLKIASNDAERGHLYEMVAQRITKVVEPQYVSDAMLRGENEEILARDIYAKNYSPVAQVGFVTNDKWGFTLGYSPDGLVGDDGQIEIKSRRQRYQVQTILDGRMPDEFLIQVQAGLLISERKWCDFISYSNGMPMFIIRVLPDARVHEAIVAAATAFELRVREKIETYHVNAAMFHATERKDYGDMIV